MPRCCSYLYKLNRMIILFRTLLKYFHFYILFVWFTIITIKSKTNCYLLYYNNKLKRIIRCNFSMLSIDVAFNGSYWSIHNHCTFRHNSFKWFPIFNTNVHSTPYTEEICKLNFYIIKTMLHCMTLNRLHESIFM